MRHASASYRKPGLQGELVRTVETVPRIDRVVSRTLAHTGTTKPSPIRIRNSAPPPNGLGVRLVIHTSVATVGVAAVMPVMFLSRVMRRNKNGQRTQNDAHEEHFSWVVG